jgi:hypothetical protein
MLMTEHWISVCWRTDIGRFEGSILLQPLQAGELMKALQSVGVVLASLLATGSTLAQDGTMMNDDMPGSGWMSGYGGYWVPILVLAVVVVLVVWVVKQQKK